MNLAMFAAVIVSLEKAKNKLTLEGNKLDRDVLKIQRTLTQELLDSFADPDNPKNEMNDKEKGMLLSNWYYDNAGVRVYPNKITTIKMIRERTGLGLLESKQMVDKFMLEYNKK